MLPEIGSPSYRCWEQYDADASLKYAFGLSAAGVVKYGADAEIQSRLAAYLEHPKAVAVGLACLDFTSAKTTEDRRAQVDGVQMMASDNPPLSLSLFCFVFGSSEALMVPPSNHARQWSTTPMPSRYRTLLPTVVLTCAMHAGVTTFLRPS